MKLIFVMMSYYFVLHSQTKNILDFFFLLWLKTIKIGRKVYLVLRNLPVQATSIDDHSRYEDEGYD